MLSSLNNITDNSLFERICIELLAHENEHYSKLIHSGSNKKNKTIKDAVDGITYIQDSAGLITHVIALECTTTERKHLQAKWLNTKEKKEGDIIKSIEKLHLVKSKNSDLKKTIVLCTNESVPSELYNEVVLKCEQEGIVLDLWDFRRLTSTLENSPEGQYINHKYFGAKIEIPSTLLLENFFHHNLLEYKKEFFYIDNSVEREIQKELETDLFNFSGLIILKGESGTGKTTVCIQLMDLLIKQNLHLVRLSPDTILNSTSLENALDKEIRKFYPHLIQSSKELLFSKKLIVIIDDINKSNFPQNVVNKIEQWVSLSSQFGNNNYLCLCPLWNRNVTYMPIKYEKTSFLKEHTLSAYTKKECVRYQLTNTKFYSNIKLFEELGNDPFLIGLYNSHNFESSRAETIIEEFVQSKLLELSNSKNVFVNEFNECIGAIIKYQLANKDLFPKEIVLYNELIKEHRTNLKYLEEEGSILHFSKNDNGEKILKFRHDRIHEYFIKIFITKLLINDSLDPLIIYNPYYSEYVGKVLAKLSYNHSLFENILKYQPVIAFYALKEIGEPSNNSEKLFCSNVILWFKKYCETDKTDCSLYDTIISIIHDVESSVVMELSDFLKNNDRRKIDIKFNNGDLRYALIYFANKINYEPSSINSHRDKILSKYRTKWIKEIVEYIKFILEKKDVEILYKKSALILAGYMKSSNLNESIINFFDISSDKQEILSETIWAVFNCCQKNLIKVLKPIFEVWANLPITTNDNFSEREKVAENIKFAIKKIDNKELENALIYYLNSLPALKNYLFLLIKEIDSPKAIETYLNIVVEYHEHFLKTDNHFGLSHLQMDFSFNLEEVKIYSKETLDKLKEIWMSNQNSHLGFYAFSYWVKSISKKNLFLLDEVTEESNYFRLAVERRLSLNDRSVANLVFMKLKKNHFRSSQKIWSNELFEKIKNELESSPNYVIYDYILSIPTNHAEVLLELYYKNLKNNRTVFSYGLYINTQKTLAISHQIFSDTDDKSSLFKYISHTFSNIFADRAKTLSKEKLDSLIPYLGVIPKDELHDIINVCQESNLMPWATEYIRDKHIKRGEKKEINEHYFVIFPSEEELLNDFFKSCRCKCNKHCHLSVWIDRLGNKGYSNEEFIIIIFKYIQLNPNIDKFKDACEALKIIGTRKDISQIREFKLKGCEAEIIEIINDTVFTIEKKSLT